MSLRILEARSSVPQKAPQPTDLQAGQMALNYAGANPFLVLKDTAGVIRRLDRAEVASAAPASPTTGQLWFDTSSTTGKLRVFDGANWSTSSGITTTPLATPAVPGVVRTASAADITAGTIGRVIDASQLLAVSSRIAQADWNAAPGTLAEILNKPTIPPQYVLPTASTTLLGGVRLADSTALANGTAGRVLDAALAKPIRDDVTSALTTANAALPKAGGAITGTLSVAGALTATGGVSGNLAGNASSATKLQTARTINGVAFDGTGDITIQATGGTPESLQPGAFIVGSSYNGDLPGTWAVDATVPANPNTVVARDGTGNVTANTFIGALQGNADSATAAASLSGNPTINGVVFDGTGPIVVTTSPGNQLPLTAGAYLTGPNYTGGAAVTFNVDGATANTPNTLVARDGSGVARATTFVGALQGNATSSNTAGNAQTADALSTPRTINNVAFDGTANIILPASSTSEIEGSGSYPIFSPRAWFHGTVAQGSTTLVTVGSGNIASATWLTPLAGKNNSWGTLTLNLTTAMPDTSGIAQGQLTLNDLSGFGGDPRNIFVQQIIWDNPSSVRLIFAIDGSNVTDFPLRFMVTVIR